MIEQLIHRIKLRQTELQVSLAEGNAANFEVYKNMVGQHQGLQIVMEMINNMLDEEKNQE